MLGAARFDDERLYWNLTSWFCERFLAQTRRLRKAGNRARGLRIMKELKERSARTTRLYVHYLDRQAWGDQPRFSDLLST
jgi:hypothetical protein